MPTTVAGDRPRIQDDQFLPHSVRELQAILQDFLSRHSRGKKSIYDSRAHPRQPRKPADLPEIHAFGRSDLGQRPEPPGIEQVLPCTFWGRKGVIKTYCYLVLPES